MIPDFDASTGNLPPGENLATWEELHGRYGYTPWRRRLLDERLLVFDNGRATQKAAFMGELFKELP